MKKLFFALAMLTASAGFSNLTLVPDTNDVGVLSKGTIPAKMLAARHEFIKNNVRGALTIYRDILKIDAAHANALYGTAECHYKLKRYELAQEYLEKSTKADAKVSKEREYFQGQIYHRVGDLDKAIASFDQFLEKNSAKSFEGGEAVRFKAQCLYAKEMLANPSVVEIKNLGRDVNSRFDDYTPSIAADGKTIIFTARRSDTRGGEIDKQGDYKYFEDIYYSSWNEEEQIWENSNSLPGEVNTESYDAVLSIAPGGDKIFIYRTDAKHAGDIFFSDFDATSQVWTLPQKMPRPINTTYYESSISVTEDGNTCFFVSERPNGIGQGDIYMSKKEGGKWGDPKNLGEKINTELDEKFVWVHPDGKTIFFSSNGLQTMGGYDIFKSSFENGQWSVPINLGSPINTVNEESTFSLTADFSKMYLAAEYADSFGERDIYVADVSNFPIVSEPVSGKDFCLVKIKIENGEGKGLKKQKVTIKNKVSGRIMEVLKTDKEGRAKIVLPTNQTYVVSATKKKTSFEAEVTLARGAEAAKVEVVVE